MSSSEKIDKRSKSVKFLDNKKMLIGKFGKIWQFNCIILTKKEL